MAKIGDDYAQILDAMIPGQNWANGSGKGIDGKKRVVKGVDVISENDINELRDAFYNFATIAGSGINLPEDQVFQTDVELGRILEIPNWIVRTDFVQVTNHQSHALAHERWDQNYADVYPPIGYTMSNIVLIQAAIGGIYFEGTRTEIPRGCFQSIPQTGVKTGHATFCQGKNMGRYYRFICGNNYSRHPAWINIISIWSK